MMLDKRKRVLIWVTFGICLVAEAFLIASLATDFWVDASPIRNVDEDTEDAGKNVSDGDLGTKFNGHIHFGLFNGYKKMDHGLGVREGDISIECDAGENICHFENGRPAIIVVNPTGPGDDDDDGMFNFGLWLCTIIFLCLGIAWGIVSMAFAVINATSSPIETITGPMGLYVWNGLASFFCLLAIIMYTVLYYTDLKKNVLSWEDRHLYLWTSEDRAYLDYSFYFVVVSTILYASNLAVIAISGVECHPLRFGRNLDDKTMDNVIMY